MIPRAYFGGISNQVIESIFLISCSLRIPVGLMFTENQCGIDSGYVTEYDKLLKKIKLMDSQFAGHKVVLSRDHLKPISFAKHEIENFEQRCFQYIDSGFSSIHLDLDFNGTDIIERLDIANKIIGKIRDKGSDVTIELSMFGDDEIGHLKSVLEYSLEMINLEPDIVVLPTGSRVYCGMQVGSFYENDVRQAAQKFHEYGILTKEHNADYLSRTDIKMRDGIIDIFNVSPELGHSQSALTILLADAIGLDTMEFQIEAYKNPNVARWMDGNHPPLKVTQICGHYVFSGQGYSNLLADIYRQENADGVVDFVLSSVLKRYLV